MTLFWLISGFFCVCESGQDLFQIRGQNGLLHNCLDPLPELSGKQEVADTANHMLETFYPVSPTIDLQKVQVYQEEANSTGKKHQIWPLKTGWFKALKLYSATLSGFTADYSYLHPHTLYFLEGVDESCKLKPEQFRAKMLMFAFGNALACAHKLYGVRFYCNCCPVCLCQWF